MSTRWHRLSAAAATAATVVLLLVSSAHPALSSSSEVEEAVPPPHGGNFPARTLRSGASMPLVGLGCASGVRDVHVRSALDAGYRLVDTAQSYDWGYREDEVGDAVRDWASVGGGSSSNANNDSVVFVQTKIHPEDLGYEATRDAVAVSFDRLHLSKIDSVLLHKPRCWEGACRKEPQGTWQESWTALEEFVDSNRIGSIGICDVDGSLLKQLLRRRIKPHIIQNWMDPFHQDRTMRERCQEEGIQYQAYSSLGTQWAHHRGHAVNPVLNDPTLLSIADAHGVDVAQVVINWATRHGVSVLPASTNPTRQASNLESFGFDLTEREMLAIGALDGKAPKKAEPNPNEVSVVFENRGEGRIDTFWVSGSSGDEGGSEGGREEVHVGTIEGNDEFRITSFHGHRFMFRKEGEGGDGTVVGEHTVARDGGRKQRHVVVRGDEL